jgi:formylglycine-generating enzyme required for sulfatase activity
LSAKLEETPRFNDSWARQHGRVAVALVALQQADRVWRLFKYTPDPRLRTELVHDFAAFGIDVQLVVDRLRAETEVSTRRALIMTLGEYPVKSVAAADRKSLTDTFLRFYQRDPDPGIHSAIEWLLRHKWGLAKVLDDIDTRLSGRDPVDDRDWYINKQRQTMAVVRGPQTFRMGPPRKVSNGDHDDAEFRIPLYAVIIDRSFAISTKEVTTENYNKFLSDNPRLRTKDNDYSVYTPTSECPILGVSWYDAVRYCNWLSQQEGIPETEWCYTAIGTGMKLRSEALKLTGYRLPTDAEWDYACRAGTLTPRPFGQSDEMLPKFAWFVENAGRKAHPVGQLKPNELGLFDMLGNAMEWTQTVYVESPEEPATQPIQDAGQDITIRDETRLVYRGSSYRGPAEFLESAFQIEDAASYFSMTTGLRVARTCKK